jgi:hypothetical protein
MRAALGAGEDRLVEPLRVLGLAQGHRAARTPERLVRGRGDDVGVGDRRGVHAAGHQTGDVGHVDHEDGPDFAGDFSEAGEIDQARVGGVTGHDDLRPMLPGKARDLGEVDHLGFAVHGVGDEAVQLAGEVHR